MCFERRVLFLMVFGSLVLLLSPLGPEDETLFLLPLVFAGG